MPRPGWPGELARETTPEIPDFTNPAWHASHADQEIVRAISAGKKAMPAMKRKLARTEVDPLIALVRAFQGGKQHIAEVPEKSTQMKPRTESERVGSLMVRLMVSLVHEPLVSPRPVMPRLTRLQPITSGSAPDVMAARVTDSRCGPAFARSRILRRGTGSATH